MDWSNFRDPTGEPDATNEKDMNTFIALTREATVDNMKDAMDWIRKVEAMATALEDAWADYLAQKNTTAQRRAVENLSILRTIILEKVDQATLPLLRFSDKYVDDRTELNIEEIADHVSVGMWATFSDMRPPRKSVQLERMGIKLDIPKPLLHQQEKFIYRFTRLPFVTYNLEAYGREFSPSIPENKSGLDVPRASHKYIVVGDLIHFDILFSPPAAYSIRAGRWTLRDRSTTSLTIRKSDYPSSAQCRLYLKVPDGVILTNDLRLAVWDESEQEWVEDGISDFQCNDASRTVTCYVTTVGILALVKRRTVDLPWKNWFLIPVVDKKINAFMDYAYHGTKGFISEAEIEKSFLGIALTGSNNGSGEKKRVPLTFERHARFSVETQQGHVIVLDILGSQCTLIQPTSSCLADLLYQPMTPGRLLRRLQRKGINLLPAPIDLEALATFASTSATSGSTSATSSLPDCHVKHVSLEERVYYEIARNAAALEFQSSTAWNASLSNSQIGLLVRESTVYTCPHECNEYDCVLVERDSVSQSFVNCPGSGPAPGPEGVQFSLVVGNDYGRRTLFSPMLRPDEQVHMDLARTLTRRVTPEGQQRMQRTSERFAKTIQTLFCLMRPFSQS